MREMKVIFISGGAREKTLEYLLNNGINIVAVVTPYVSEKNARFSRVLDVAKAYGITIYQVTNESIVNTVNSIDADVLLSCGFSFKIPDAVINHFEHSINVHPTLLPCYRGYRSGPYILINGEKESGVTVHKLSSEIDKGDILYQESFPVSNFDTPKSMKRKTDECEKETVLEALRLIESNNVKYRKQDESLASTYNYMRTPKDSLIDCTKPLIELYNEIRACDAEDYPAFFYIGEEKVCIKMWRASKPDGEEDMI